MEQTNSRLSRRSLLGALPATGAMLILPVASVSDARTIEGLFVQWWKLRCQLNQSGQWPPEHLWDAWRALEDQILTMPTETPADLARKLFVVTDGDFLGEMSPESPISAELETLALEGLL